MNTGMQRDSRNRDKPFQDRALRDFFVSWLLFWVFALLGLGILAGTHLAGSWAENQELQSEYGLLVAQNDELEQQLSQLESRISASRNNPQYTERVLRRQLNLRKEGQETVSVQAVPIDPPTAPAEGRIDGLLQRRWFRVFANDDNRLWLIGLGGGLIFAAFLVAAGRPQRSAG